MELQTESYIVLGIWTAVLLIDKVRIWFRKDPIEKISQSLEEIHKNLVEQNNLNAGNHRLLKANANRLANIEPKIEHLEEWHDKPDGQGGMLWYGTWIKEKLNIIINLLQRNGKVNKDSARS